MQVGTYISKAAMENSIEVAQKIKIACDPAIQLQGMYSKDVKLE